MTPFPVNSSNQLFRFYFTSNLFFSWQLIFAYPFGASSFISTSQYSGKDLRSILKFYVQFFLSSTCYKFQISHNPQIQSLSSQPSFVWIFLCGPWSESTSSHKIRTIVGLTSFVSIWDHIFALPVSQCLKIDISYILPYFLIFKHIFWYSLLHAGQNSLLLLSVESSFIKQELHCRSLCFQSSFFSPSFKVYS